MFDRFLTPIYLVIKERIPKEKLRLVGTKNLHYYLV